MHDEVQWPGAVFDANKCVRDIHVLTQAFAALPPACQNTLGTYV